MYRYTEYTLPVLCSASQGDHTLPRPKALKGQCTTLFCPDGVVAIADPEEGTWSGARKFDSFCTLAGARICFLFSTSTAQDSISEFVWPRNSQSAALSVPSVHEHHVSKAKCEWRGGHFPPVNQQASKCSLRSGAFVAQIASIAAHNRCCSCRSRLASKVLAFRLICGRPTRTFVAAQNSNERTCYRTRLPRFGNHAQRLNRLRRISCAFVSCLPDSL